MTNPKNREELDEYKELSSSEEEQDNQPSAAGDTEEEECRKKGGVWNKNTRKCENRVDPNRDLDLESELDTQTELSFSEEERLPDNQPSVTEATEEQKCPKGQKWNPQTRQCEGSPDQGDAPAL